MTRWLAFVLVATFLLAGTAASAGDGTDACAYQEQGLILVPAGTDAPRLFASSTFHGVHVWFIYEIEEAPFWLVHLGSEVQWEDQVVPDFNIGFYNSNDESLGYYREAGDEFGQVPQGSVYAVVWMRYGPALDLTPLDFTLRNFVYAQGCPDEGPQV